MSFQYKIKSYRDEEGEFTDDLPCDVELIEKIISDFWTGETMPNGLKQIVISNNLGWHLVLEHFGKDAFEVYFLFNGESFHYHKMSGIDWAHNCVDAFFQNDYPWLETNLNRTKSENRRIRKDILSTTFEFEVTRERIWSALSQIIFFGLPLGLICIVVAIVGFVKFPYINILVLLVLFILIFGIWLWLPGLFLHKKYEEDNSRFSIYLSKGVDSIQINIDGIQKRMQKNEIEKITVFHNPAFRLPWSEYGYTEVRFKSGELINLTNLMIDQYLMHHKFPGIEVNVRNSIFPNLNQDTFIKNESE